MKKRTVVNEVKKSSGYFSVEKKNSSATVNHQNIFPTIIEWLEKKLIPLQKQHNSRGKPGKTNVNFRAYKNPCVNSKPPQKF